MQCYDAFSLSDGDSNDDEDEGFSSSFVVILVSCTCAASLLLGALLSFVGYRYVNRRSLTKPLLNSDQFREPQSDVKYGVVGTEESGVH